MGNTRFKESSVFFYFVDLQNEENYERKENQVVPDEVLSKEFLSRFKTEVE